MSTKRFSVNTEAHRAEIGDDLVLEFSPEVGSEFLDGYGKLLETQEGVTEDAAGAKKRVDAAREFLAELALPESAAQLRDTENVKIPLRILTQLIEWLTGLYTGSDSEDAEGKVVKGARPTTRR